jgi:hypothetical protein
MARPTLSQTVAFGREFRAALTDDEAEIWLRLGVVADFWRNPAEEFHFHVSDDEMARITIATYRSVVSHIGVDDVQWVPVIATVRDGRRQVLDGQTVASVFGADWPALRRRVTAKIRTARNVWDDSADYQVIATFALIRNGMVFGNHWFGSPAWPGIVDDYVSLLGEGELARASANPGPIAWQASRRRAPHATRGPFLRFVFEVGHPQLKTPLRR